MIRTTRYVRPTLADLLFTLVAAIMATAGAVRLTQSDGDLAAHIRVGDTIIATGTPRLATAFAFTTAPGRFVEHSWLADVLFAAFDRVGGLALCAAVAALVIAATHVGVFVFLRNRGAGEWAALAGALGSLALGAVHWLARPHMFTIAFAFATVLLLERGTRWTLPWIAALFVVWANVHGGWVYGLVLVTTYAVGDAVEWYVAPAASAARAAWGARFASHTVAIVCAAVSVLANPYGVHLYGDVFGTLGRPVVTSGLVEYQSPSFHTASGAVLLAALLVAMTTFAFARRRPPMSSLLVVLGNTAIALFSARNIALFAVTAWPLLLAHAVRTVAVPRGARRHLREEPPEIPGRPYATNITAWSALSAALLISLGAHRGRFGGVSIVSDAFDPRRMPVGAVARARAAALRGHLYTPWTWGGYVMYAWPEQAPFLDPLRFSTEVAAVHGRIETVQRGWATELRRQNVSLVLVPPASGVATALADAADWSVWYRDRTAVLFRRMCTGECRGARPGTASECGARSSGAL